MRTWVGSQFSSSYHRKTFLAIDASNAIAELCIVNLRVSSLVVWMMSYDVYALDTFKVPLTDIPEVWVLWLFKYRARIHHNELFHKLMRGKCRQVSS